MARTFYLFTDPALTVPFVGPLLAGDPSQDATLYFGSPDATRRVRASSTPGTDPIVLTPTDANPGAGHQASEIKLALDAPGLDAAIAGDPLSLGVTVLGGVGNAVPIFIRLTDGTGGAPGVDNDLSIAWTELVEDSI